MNTAQPLELAALRGKFVLLDFWTYCCINCMHILPELKKLEQKYADSLVVIGVHSAKFATEREAENIRQAILRYGIAHPVVNDSQLVLWQRYAVDVWPSLRVIDPEGNLIAYHTGEITFEQLDRFFQPAVAAYRRKRVLDEKPTSFRSRSPARNPHALEVPRQDPGRRGQPTDLHRRQRPPPHRDRRSAGATGGGRRQRQARKGGRCPGAGGVQPPAGPGLARRHVVRRRHREPPDPQSGFGPAPRGHDGGQRKASSRRPETRRHIPRGTSLASPWDLWIHDGDLYIAMAGLHQIWKMDLEGGAIGPYAGNGIEDIVDGPLLPKTAGQPGSASFAQPSGLTSDGQRLFVADSEGSSIRAVPLGGTGSVTTVLGTAGLASRRLFTFGDRDGPAGQALLQHPLGVAYFDGAIYIADTYNDKVKRLGLTPPYDVQTIGGAATVFDEPSGLSAADGILYVADTNHHAIRTIDLKNPSSVGTWEVAGLTPPPVWGISGQEKPSAPAPRAE